MAHVLQGLCELDDHCTVTSIDGTSAYDLVSRAAMLDGLLNRVGGKALPFVRMFYGSPSSYMWEDAEGVEHTIRQGEGGEQGDALMPLLFCLGQHSALEAVQEDMREGEFLFAYLDDIYIVTRPERVGPVYASLREHLQSFARIRIHGGKTQVWNRAGVRPPVCVVLERIAQADNPNARVWRGSQDSDLVPGQQGITVLGTPLGNAAFVESQLEICSQLGSFSCTVPRLGRIICCGWSNPRQSLSTPGPTTTASGSVCAPFCTSVRTCHLTPGAQRTCPFSLEVLGCAARAE